MSSATLPGGLEFRRLDASEAPAFGAMTFPAHKHLLSLEPSPRIQKGQQAEEDAFKVQPWAFGALGDDGKPAALALLLAPLEEGLLAQLLSVFVMPPYRRQGVGTALLKALETQIQELGAPGMRTTYSSAKNYASIVEKMFEHCAWREPHVRMHFFNILLEDLSKLTRRLSKPRKGYEISLWCDVTPEEHKQLLEESWTDMQITPKLDEEGYHRETSMALRYHGRLVGWALTESLSPERGRVNSTYVRPDLARTGALIPMLAKSAEIAKGMGYRTITFTAVPSHAKLMHFAYRRLAPLCYSVIESRGAERHFSDN